MNRGETRQQFLHAAEVSILKSLRRTECARFSELMHPTGLTSDNFKFYLRNLVRLGWIEKASTGEYGLTPSGKELANNLDETKRLAQKQPKISVIVVAVRTNATGEPEYLFQRRRRHPYYGFWGSITGPVQWGEDLEETAARELHKQTGLSGICKVHAFCRATDYDGEKAILEDKLFAVILARHCKGSLSTDWGGGENAWMTVKELSAQEKFFSNTTPIIDLVENGKPYLSLAGQYQAEDY